MPVRWLIPSSPMGQQMALIPLFLWPSDVIAGWAIALPCLITVITALTRAEFYRA
ncbi:MAG: hypothetical protein VKL39_07830 [Leptolyngbyaceae bacterium]|nr:hypothetical protein [Leptolyngbyaceae bacterium]